MLAEIPLADDLQATAEAPLVTVGESETPGQHVFDIDKAADGTKRRRKRKRQRTPQELEAKLLRRIFKHPGPFIEIRNTQRTCFTPSFSTTRPDELAGHVRASLVLREISKATHTQLPSTKPIHQPAPSPPLCTR
jgi:hypothetical protein